MDGGLIAFGDDGKPSFPRLCQRMLHGHDDIPVVFIAFDVLHARGESTLRRPYRETDLRRPVKSGPPCAEPEIRTAALGHPVSWYR